MKASERVQVRRLAGKLFAHAAGIQNEDDSKLIIDRRFWGRGTNKGGALLSQDNDDNPNLCCLGFLCLERGMTTTQIYEAGMPAGTRIDTHGNPLEHVPSRLSAFIQKIEDYPYPQDTELTHALVEVNDARLTKRITKATLRLAGSRWKSPTLKTEARREHLITRLFATAGITVHFVN